MKIKVFNWNKYWHYEIRNHKQKEFDYIYKYLDFEKISKKWHIYFNNEETKEWFKKTYKSSDWLDDIYNDSPEGYQWLKANLGNSVFKLYCVYYLNKQELKTIVNKIINVKLINKKWII